MSRNINPIFHDVGDAYLQKVLVHLLRLRIRNMEVQGTRFDIYVYIQ